MVSSSLSNQSISKSTSLHFLARNEIEINSPSGLPHFLFQPIHGPFLAIHLLAFSIEWSLNIFLFDFWLVRTVDMAVSTRFLSAPSPAPISLAVGAQSQRAAKEMLHDLSRQDPPSPPPNPPPSPSRAMIHDTAYAA